MQLHPAQQSIWQTRGNLSPAAAFSASSPAPGIFSSANEPLANGSAAQASASAEAQAALTAAGLGSSASSNGISAAAYSVGLSSAGRASSQLSSTQFSSSQPSSSQLSSSELAVKLPSARGVSASSLFSEYLSKQQGEKNSVDYDSPTQSRAAISEYLLNQHAQRRDEIRAMVGVDLYA